MQLQNWHMLLVLTVLTGVGVYNSKLQIPLLGWATFLLSIGLIIYAHILSTKQNSLYLDQNFENEKQDLGNINKPTFSFSLRNIFSVLFYQFQQYSRKKDPTGRHEYNATYTYAYLLWIPCAWFIWGMLLGSLGII